MKKITLLLTLISFVAFSQQKTTGLVNLSSNMTAILLLNDSNNTVTLTLSGPNDRWFALQFGMFDSGMQEGTDIVYWNNSTLVDARHNGIGQAPTSDATNNWTLVSSTNNSPSMGLRTIVFTRNFDTGDANDYVFDFNNTTIDLAWARFSSASFALAYHGGSNRGLALNTPLTTLGVEDFSLNASEIYPNPTQGNFLIRTKTNLEKVIIYSQTGALVKTIDVVISNANEIEISSEGLQAGIYLLELQNETEKSWKKLIVN